MGPGSRSRSLSSGGASRRPVGSLVRDDVGGCIFRFNFQTVIPGWCVCTIPGISRFRVRCFASPRNDEAGLLRRFRLRSLSYGGQVAPRNDGKHSFAISPHVSARGLPGTSRLLTIEGAGNAGRSLHPQPRVRNETKHTSVVTTGSDGFNRHSPRNGFTVSFVLSPVTRLV
jgi:hypothetical protein